MSTDPTPSPTRTTRPRASLIAAIVATLVFAIAIFVASPASTAAAQSSPQITSDGIGNAVVGSSRSQLAAQLGPDYTFGPLEVALVDVEGYEVRRNGVVQFIAAAVNPVSPDTPLDLFIVRTPGVTTADGIGVGSTVGDAVAVYGSATITRNSDNESREFADFENHPDRLSFRTFGGITGTYPGDDSIADVEITEVWVSCLARLDDCPPQPELPYTGSTQTLLLFASAALATAGFALVYTENRLAKKQADNI